MPKLEHWILAGALTLGGFAGAAIANERGEEGHAHQKVTMDQLPSAVRSSFQHEAAGGQVEDLRRETRNGKTIYEGEVVSNGKGTDLQIAEDGSVVKRSATHDESTEGDHNEK